MQDASFSTQDTALGRPGAVVYGASCKCDFSHNYPFAFGPRLGGAYQLDSKTVIRGGAGIQYDVEEAPNGVLYSAADYTVVNANGYGFSPLQYQTTYSTANGLQAGNAYAPGNPYGNPPAVWPNLDQNKYPFSNNGVRAPSSPFVFFDPSNRPGRTVTWSIGVQREVLKNLVAEVSYVGNRGAYFPAPNMDQIASNSLTPALLKSQFGIDFSNDVKSNCPAGVATGGTGCLTDRDLLTQPMTSALVQARFPKFAIVNVNGQPTIPSVYPGFPAGQQLIQAFRNVPQWGSVSPWLGPPLGKTWYDSMQIKVTKRYSHGLQASGNFTWAKGEVIGSASDSSYYLGNQAVTTDIYNYNNNKQLNQYVRPLALTITFSYTTPGFHADGFAMKALSNVARGWQLSSVLRYQSGALIGLPTSLNGLTAQLGRQNTFTQNFGNNFWNLTGKPLFLVDPNCHCFDPQHTQVLNPAAFVDAPAGQWSTSAPFYNNFRWQRQPAESMAFARNFKLGKEDRANLQVRAEFQNVFNRTFLSAPSVANPNLPITSTPYVGQVINNAGFGSITTLNGLGSQPRSGQIILRVQF